MFLHLLIFGHVAGLLAQNPFFCPDGPVSCMEDLYPDPNDCTKYYQCDSVCQAFHRTCPSNLHFANQFKQCRWPWEAQCFATPLPTTEGPSTPPGPVVTTPLPTEPPTEPPTTEPPFQTTVVQSTQPPITGPTPTPGVAVAFTAFLERERYNNLDPLIFDGVEPNFDQAVVQNRIFQVPESGFYYFSMSAAALGGYALDYALEVENNREVSIKRTSLSHTLADTTSRDYLRYLNAGSIVNIRSTSFGLYSDFEIQTSWSGFGLGSEVIFSVAHMSSESGLLDPFPFNQVLLNVGGGYQEGAFRFVAPSDGIYFFHISVGHQPRTPVNFDLRLNGERFIDLFRGTTEHNGVDTTSRSFLVALSQADVLHVVNNENSGTYSDGELLTSFAGFKYAVSEPVAWCLARTSSWTGDTSSMYPVMYDHIEVNVGNPLPWDPVDNKVVIPKFGFYFVHLSTGTLEGYTVNYSLTTNDFITADILKRHTLGQNTISRSVILYLWTGDVLKIGAGQGTAMYSNEELQTSFSGFWLFDQTGGK